MADTRRIAKNTVYMYFRMILIMLVTIYTSRVILDKLGIDDYGLYNAVASVVAMIVFLNQTLTTSTTRFLTYDLGVGDEVQLNNTFSTAFLSHLALALFIVIIMETLGLWYMSNRFVIPEGRESATIIVFHISIFITAISVCLVPYSALITAHEDMDIYAYVGIFDVVAKLLVVYLLDLSPIDKLISFAVLLMGVQILVAIIYITISSCKYRESKLKANICKRTLKKMFEFTGWTAVANISNTLMVQGSILLLNLFFAPAVIAAKALADQVTSAIMQFVNNFRTAMNPQIIKSYASNESEISKWLTLKSTVISFDLMLILGLPFVFTMKMVLSLWLKEVPPYAILFTQVAIISQIINTVSSSTYIAFVSSGKLRNNAIWSVICGVLFFAFLFMAFKFGGDAIWVQYVYMIITLLLVLVLRPWLLVKDVNYDLKSIANCYMSCFKVLLPSSVLSYLLYLMSPYNLAGQIILFIGVGLVCATSSYVMLDKEIKIKVKDIIKHRIKTVL